MGEVGAPGQFTYVPGMTVQNAIALAGGYTSRATMATPTSPQDQWPRDDRRVVISDAVLAATPFYVRERFF